VKQILRAVDAGFDERRYGFSGLNDLVRACQRESIFRIERDRQGVLRVFPGPALQRAAAPVEEVAATEPHAAEVDTETQASEPAEEAAAAEATGVSEETPVDQPSAERPSRRRRAATPRKPAAPRQRKPRARKTVPTQA
jgi:hypothetical protein